MNGNFSLYECRLNGGDTWTLPAVIRFVWAFLHTEAVGMQKHFLFTIYLQVIYETLEWKIELLTDVQNFPCFVYALWV